jgi:predicted metal-binding protein
MGARIFVCVTCDRYSAGSQGPSRGALFATCVESTARGLPVTIRRVECLNGCPHPCNAALRDLGKSSFRFSKLDEEDAADLVDIAVRYGASSDGAISTGRLARKVISTYVRQKP